LGIRFTSRENKGKSFLYTTFDIVSREEPTRKRMTAETGPVLRIGHAIRKNIRMRKLFGNLL